MSVFMLNNWPLSFPPEETFSHATPFVCQQIPMRSFVHSAKRCCYRKSICEGVLRIRIFLLCTPLLLPLDIYMTWFVKSVAKTIHTLCVTSQDILLLKETKHQLFVYDKMQILNISLMPILRFSSVSGPLQDCLKTGCRNSLTQINMGNYWLHCWGHEFPIT
jgi:hypothetical protein